VLRAAADLWVAFGIALLLMLLLEAGYRGFRRLRPANPRAAAPVVDSLLHPYAGLDWWPELLRTHERSPVSRYDSYREYVALPYASPWVNIDSAGRRVTPQPRPESPAPRRIVFLGGSTMWGYAARDSFTIPAYTAQALRARGFRDLELVNLAQIGYTATQEAITLLLELARDRRPALAVFFDGYNDVSTAITHGVPGLTYNFPRIERQTRLGNRGFGAELLGLGRHSALIQRLLAAAGPPLPEERWAGEEVCAPQAAYYRNLVLAVDGLARAAGFRTLWLQQPLHTTSGKPLTAWERSLYNKKAMATCLRAVDSVLAGAPVRYHSLANVFDAETASLFVDYQSHLTEAGNRLVAERIAALLDPLLRDSAR
jgi:hypothetical protein